MTDIGKIRRRIIVVPKRTDEPATPPERKQEPVRKPETPPTPKREKEKVHG